MVKGKDAVSGTPGWKLMTPALRGGCGPLTMVWPRRESFCGAASPVRSAASGRFCWIGATHVPEPARASIKPSASSWS